VLNVLAFGTRSEGVHIPAMSLFYWVATLGKLFTHIAFPVSFKKLNCGIKGTIQLDRFNGLTG